MRLKKSMVISEVFLIAVLFLWLMTMTPVLATHTSSASIEPEFAAANSSVTYTITVTNEEGAPIQLVKIHVPTDFFVVECKEVDGWYIESNPAYCKYTSHSTTIESGKSQDFNILVKTGDECNHTWFVYTTDISDGWYATNVTTEIDATPPATEIRVGEPKVSCTEEEGCDWWITQDTEIDLNCKNVGPHKSPLDKLQWRIKIDDGNWSEWYETQAGIEGMDLTIKFTEDSIHYLQYKCNDTVGNEEEIKEKIFRVDSKPPETTKELIGPWFFNETENKTYINSKTKIKLTCVDKEEPCAVGVDNIQYRYRVKAKKCGNWYPWSDWFVYNETTMIQFKEESCHELEYYCNDSLGNEEEHHHQIYYVDITPPNTSKKYGKPYYYNEETGEEWITPDTPISLTATDGEEDHASGVKETLYKVWVYNETSEGDCEWFGLNKSKWYECEDQCYEENEVCEEDCHWIPKMDWTEYSEPFTIGQESLHKICYHSVDNVENTEKINCQVVYVDGTGPEPVKTIGNPKTECEDERCGWDWFITLLTPITLDCEDPEPHPAGSKELCFRVELDGEENTTRYCDYYNGTMIDDWCCLKPPLENFLFGEEGTHKLEFYCTDKLNNTGNIDSEIFKVEGGVFKIKLNKKWNLISVPFVLIDDDPAKVFENITGLESVWTYDGEKDEWFVWTPDSKPDTLHEIIPGWGYWVKMNKSDELLIGGSLMKPLDLPPSRKLVEGWNLIGYYGTSGLEGYYGPDDEWPYGHGDWSYCALYSLRNLENWLNPTLWPSLYTYWKGKWIGLDGCTKMDPGAGYWLFMDVEDIYAPATACPKELVDMFCYSTKEYLTKE